MNVRHLLLATVLGLLIWLLVAWLVASPGLPDATRVVTTPSGQHQADVRLAQVHNLWAETAADHEAWFTELERQETVRRKAEAARRARAVKRPAVVRVQSVGDIWWSLALCESGGNPRAVSRTGRYRGAFQFDMDSYRRAGGSGDPINDSYETQKAAAVRWQRLTGWHSWPTCARKLGLL
jgi:hypothetical protein